MTDADAQDLARKYDLRLLCDPAHASIGWEFRKKSGHGYACVQVIIGPVECGIYWRFLPWSYIWFFEKLYLLCNFIPSRFIRVEQELIASLKTDALDTDIVENAIKERLIEA